MDQQRCLEFAPAFQRIPISVMKLPSKSIERLTVQQACEIVELSREMALSVAAMLELRVAEVECNNDQNSM